jgi:SAM-dependent methyltransferase
VIRVDKEIRRSLRRRGFRGTVRFLLGKFLSLRHRFSSSWRQARRREIEFDRLHGVDTRGTVRLSSLTIESENLDSGNRYSATPPLLAQSVLSQLSIRYEDFVFVDVGSGKGRVLLVASEFPFSKVIGVEFSPELHRIAVQNIRNYVSPTQQCHDVESVCMDAATFPIPDEPVVLYLYHPFEEDVNRKFLRNIEQSMQRSPRDLLIVYMEPHIHGGLLEDAPFLEKLRSEGAHAIYKAASPK